MSAPTSQPPRDLATRLRDEAEDLEATIVEHTKRFGAYVHEENGRVYSSAIIEYQLNRRDVGDEPRLLRAAADELDRLGAIEQRAKELQKRNRAFDGRVKTEPGRTSVRDCLAVCDYILEGEQP
jgi:hypothetical protein